MENRKETGVLGKHVDDALVERARSGDAEAFSQLYAAIAGPLYKTATYILGSAAEAEDVVMDTIADAYAGIAKLREPAAFEGWIYKILYNKARRRRGIILWRGETELNEGLAADTVDVAENADLKEALGRLTLEEQTIVVMAVCSGYTSMEIAKVLSINPATVRSKQSRAMAKMRRYLEQQEGRKTT